MCVCVCVCVHMCAYVCMCVLCGCVGVWVGGGGKVWPSQWETCNTQFTRSGYCMYTGPV